MSECPCGSGRAYDACCGPVISGQRPATTAEALMRARYTAFTRVDMPFIEQSNAASTRGQMDLKGMEQWARSAEWRGLDVIRVEQGGQNDSRGEIEFKAYYRLQNKDCVLHEIGEFERQKGRWFYLDSQLPDVQQYVRETPKVGRNEPCPCGSGKKYKKCCLAA